MSVSLRFIHFNDGHNAEERTVEPVGGAARFLTAVREARNGHDAMVLFSGDVFSPSPVSTMTKGHHLLPILNSIGITAATVGNHDFDFGGDELSRLVSRCDFPWVISNLSIGGKETLPHTLTYLVHERKGVRIGIFGVVEREWLDTLANLPESLQYTDFIQTADAMTKMLKHDHACDIVLCLTHMREANDTRLLDTVTDIDIVFGGHDHIYKTVTRGNRLLVKSWCDFRSMSVVDVTVERADQELAHRKIVSLECQRVDITRDVRADPLAKAYLETQVPKGLHKNMAKVVAITETPLDARTCTVRSQESNLGNLTAGLIRARYGADVALLCGGTFRSDTLYLAGPITYRDIMSIFAFQDPVVVLEVTGHQLLKALENGVSKYPRLEGRFPQISGMRFAFDPSLEPGSRVVDVVVGPDETPLDEQASYTLATRSYIANGGDGYACLKQAKLVVDEEAGLLPSIILISAFQAYDVIKQWKAHHRIVRAAIAAWRGCRPAKPSRQLSWSDIASTWDDKNLAQLQQQDDLHVGDEQTAFSPPCKEQPVAEGTVLATKDSAPETVASVPAAPRRDQVGVVVRPYTDGRIRVVGTATDSEAKAPSSSSPQRRRRRLSQSIVAGVPNIPHVSPEQLSVFEDDEVSSLFASEAELASMMHDVEEDLAAKRAKRRE